MGFCFFIINLVDFLKFKVIIIVLIIVINKIKFVFKNGKIYEVYSVLFKFLIFIWKLKSFEIIFLRFNVVIF